MSMFHTADKPHTLNSRCNSSVLAGTSGHSHSDAFDAIFISLEWRQDSSFRCCVLAARNYKEKWKQFPTCHQLLEKSVTPQSHFLFISVPFCHHRQAFLSTVTRKDAICIKTRWKCCAMKTTTVNSVAKSHSFQQAPCGHISEKL